MLMISQVCGPACSNQLADAAAGSASTPSRS